MLNKISIYLIFIFEILMCQCYFTHGSLKMPDFRWTQTFCIASYGKWINLHNNAVFHDFGVSPYHPKMICWVKYDKIQFSRPFFDIAVILEIYAILLMFRIIAKMI